MGIIILANIMRRAWITFNPVDPRVIPRCSGYRASPAWKNCYDASFITSDEFFLRLLFDVNKRNNRYRRVRYVISSLIYSRIG